MRCQTHIKTGPTTRPKTRMALALVAILVASACTSPTAGILETTLPQAQRNYFTYCSGYGCTHRWNMVITDDEWETIRTLFANTPESAEAERTQIALAIGEIEKIVGPKAHTENDNAGAKVLNFGSTRGQLDCIDESHNSYLFLHFMQSDGFFKWHRIGPIALRGMIIDRWFHNTAVVVENETGDAYVIDSWFGLPGAPADVLPLDIWMDGWHPDNFVNGASREMIEAYQAND